MEPKEVWSTYMVLTRVESDFRDLKEALDMRPVNHRKETRVETHLFLCVLAYHLQAAIEHPMQQPDAHTSWESLCKVLGLSQRPRPQPRLHCKSTRVAPV